MNISYTWLKEYIPLEQKPEELGEILTSLGLEVSGIDRYESVKGGLEGVVAGKVLTCEKHPNADRLQLCTVDVGADEPLQIVCGAPNVAAGQTVWVATVGTTLYPLGSEEPLELRKVKVRGEVSNGMICAEDELGLGEDHTGIMVLPDTIEQGTRAREYYNISEDHIFDIDLTPNRSDAICHLGVARDLAAYLTVQTGESVSVKHPDPVTPDATMSDEPVTVEVRNSEACPRYSGVLIEGVEVGPSPEWLQTRLRSIGLRPINNIVDVTNFVLHEMGQPLHAFDADKIGGNGVVVDTLPEGTVFKTLDEVDRRLSAEDLMICDAEGKGMCIAGVFGGIGTGVTEKTKRVFLESAHFNPLWIRRTSTRHLLRTDAARAFEKTTDPNICLDVLERAASLITRLTGGHIASEMIDIYPEKIEKPVVEVRWSQIAKLTGVDMPRESVLQILDALSIDIQAKDEKKLVVRIPTDKADVTREADVIEEILRIYGFNNVPFKKTIEVAMSPEAYPTRYSLRNTLGGMLVSLGFHEAMALSITESSRFEKGAMALEKSQQILIDNTSNIDLNLMRPDLLVSGLESIAYNHSRNQTDIKLFEFGHGYRMHEEQIDEREFMSLMLTGNDRPPNWLESDSDSPGFYHLKGYVDSICQRYGLGNCKTSELADQRFSYGLEYTTDNASAVVFGSVKQSITDEFDIRGEVFFAQFDFEVLFKAYRETTITVQEPSRYPGTSRDLAFVLPERVSYAELEGLVMQKGGQYLREVRLFDIYRSDEHLGAGKKSYAVQLSFESPEKTLTDKEIDSVIDRLVKAVAKQLDGVLRD